MATSTPRAGFVRPEVTDTTEWHDLYTPFLDDVDSAVGAELYAASAIPASGFSGKVVYDQTYRAEQIRDGSAWYYASPPTASSVSSITATHTGQLATQTSDRTIKIYSGSAWEDPTPAASAQLATYITASTQSCANNTDTFVLFDGTPEASTSYVTRTTAASGAGGGSVFTINNTGTYIMTAQAVWASNNTGNRQIHVVDGTNSNNRWASNSVDCSGNPEAVPNAAGVRRFTAGDSIRVMVSQNSGGPLDLENKAWGVRPRVSIARIGG